MQEKVFCESGLCFKFPEEACGIKLDDQEPELPQGMSLVDFVVSWRRKSLLVEVKNPNVPGAHPLVRDAFDKEFTSRDSINGKLVPKARDSYCYLHLMRKDGSPFVFVFVLGENPS